MTTKLECTIHFTNEHYLNVLYILTWVLFYIIYGPWM